VSSSNDATGSGPWPEPDEADARAEAERLGARAAAVTAGLDAAGDRAVDHLDDIDDHVEAWDERTDPQGSRGVSLGVAGLSVAYLLILPVLLAIGIYTYITVYAIVKAVDAGSDSADAGVVLVGVVGLVTLFVVLLGGGLWAIGRAADPKRRPKY
jgi:hypothetical protein